MIDINTIRRWMSLKAQAKSVIEQERSLRADIVNFIIGEGFGTKHYAFDKIEATVRRGKRYSITRDQVLAISDQLNDAEKACIEWKPSIVMKHYKELPEDSILRLHVTMKPDSPTLDITDMED